MCSNTQPKQFGTSGPLGMIGSGSAGIRPSQRQSTASAGFRSNLAPMTTPQQQPAPQLPTPNDPSFPVYDEPPWLDPYGY